MRAFVVALCAAIAMVVPATGAAAAAEPGVRVTFGDDASVRLGRMGPLPYDARPGSALASIDDSGAGQLSLHAEQADISLAPVRLVPQLPFVPLSLDLTARTLDGEVDLCTGSARLRLDAELRPSFAGQSRTDVSVELTDTAPMDTFGTVRVGGTARVAATGNRIVDGLLGLPGPLEADIPLHVDFPRDTPQRCPSAPPAADPARARMTVLPGSRLLISRFPPFAYDAKGSGGVGTSRETAPGHHDIAFEGADLRIPPVRFLPGLDTIRVDILTNGISGTVDTTTGAVDLAFDAMFQPVVGTFRPSAISVVTELTTGTSSGYFRTLTGDPMDAWGDVHLVGVAKVPRTGDLLVDWFLALPTDAVADLRVHLDLGR